MICEPDPFLLEVAELVGHQKPEALSIFVMMLVNGVPVTSPAAILFNPRVTLPSSYRLLAEALERNAKDFRQEAARLEQVEASGGPS